MCPFLQVDSSETLSDSDAEGKALTEVHSIGVQVEDDKRQVKFRLDKCNYKYKVSSLVSNLFKSESRIKRALI